MPTTPDRLSPRTVLAGTFLVFLGPFLLVELFPAQLDMVVDKGAYLVFHNTAEFFSIMVSLSVFSIGWFTYDQSKDRHALFLGAAFLAVGLLDFMHTMSNAAMPAFLTPNSTNKSTQFWIMARLFNASAFLASSYISPASQGRWLAKESLLAVVLVFTGLVFAGVVFFPSFLPATAIQGVGLTPLKRSLEFLVIFLLAVAAIRYWRRMMRTADRSLIYFPAAFIICIFSEGAFASYKTGFDTYNILGHIYKVAAFYLIYKGVFIASVQAPYERLKDEQRLMHLASFPQLNPNPVLEITSSGEISFTNPAAVGILDDLGMDRNDFSVFLPEDFDSIRTQLSTKQETTLQREITIKDRVFREHIHLTPQFDSVRIYASDISRQKRSEEAIRESERRYHSLFDNMLEGFAYCKMLYDDQGRPKDFVCIDVNDAFARLTGLENVMGRRVTEVIPGIRESYQDLFEIYGRVALTGNPEKFELDFKLLAKWLSLSVYSTEKDYFVVVFDDITERKKTEEILRLLSSELETARLRAENDRRFLESVMEALPTGVAIVDALGGNIRSNSAFERVWGGTPPATQSVEDYAAYRAWWPDTGALVAPEEWATALAVQKGETVTGQLLRIQRFDGSEAIVINSASPIRDARGGIIGSAVAIQDITELKRAEEAIREREARYRAIGESIDYGVWVCDAAGRNIYASESFLKLVGITQEECSDFGWGKALHPEDAEDTIAAWQECSRTGGKWDREHRFLGVDGQYHAILARGVPIKNDLGQIVSWAGINLDISRIKKAEEKLVASLREKEVLLKEIHHRVKNNMQVVYSLLNLQAKGIADETVRAMFEESRNRVMSMALVHENLYRSKDLAFIDFKVYLQGLVTNIVNSFLRHDIVLAVDMDPIALDVNAGIPCGLIVNELVSNSLKHGFPGERQGRIVVSLSKNSPGDYVLSVTDNGIGLPAGMDIRKAPTLGLRLVFMLTRQLHGAVELPEVEEGSRFMITFPKRPEVKGEANGQTKSHAGGG